MNARFIWAGKGKDRSEHVSFSNPNNYIEYGPIISWDFRTSTVNHSAEATVVIPQHSGITPASSTYGNASINAGDHVFLQDMDNPTGYGGVAFIHGTVDKVKYRNNMMEIHFRNPMSFLANNNIKASGIPRSYDGSYMTTSGIPFRQLSGNTWQYYPNYVGDSTGWRPYSIINHLVREFAGADVGGPFVGVRVDPGSQGDGLNMFPNFELAGKVSLLNAILQLAEATRWSNSSGWGHEVLANITQSGSGFSTELFVFRRGAYEFANRFVYGDASTNEYPIMSYDFPEQTFDVPTGGAVSGVRNLNEEDSAISIADINSSIFTSINNLIYRASAGLVGSENVFKSSGRATFQDYPWLTNRDSLADALMGAMVGVGTNRGPRVGSIQVAGWVSNTLFPGFLARVHIPEAGIVNQTFVIDEVQYSEPEGITTIQFNRSGNDSIVGQLGELVRREEVLTSRATSCIDSGWIRADGNATGTGRWDDEPEVNAPKRHRSVAIQYEGEQYKNNYSFNFNHNLGYIPSRVVFEVGYQGIGAGANQSIDGRTITTVPSETYVAETDSYFGHVSIENSPFHWRCVYHHNIGYNRTLQNWFERTDDNVYLRCRVYP